MKSSQRSRALRWGSLLTAGALVLTACDTQAMAGGPQVIEVKADGSYSPEHLMGRSMVGFGEAVTEASDGQVVFEMYFADALVKQSEIATSLPAGIVDLGYAGMAYTPAEFQVDRWASQLGYGNDTRPVVGLLASAAAMIEFGFSEPALREELEREGIYPLLPRFQNFDNYHLLCKEPVTSASDLVGKRVRVGGPAYADTAEALGMSPVSLSGSEIYEGFERGIVDCFMGNEIDMMGNGLWELGASYLEVNLPGWNSISLASSQNFFDSLTEAEREAFHTSVPDFLDIYYTEFLKDQHRFFTEGAEEHDVDFLTPDADLVERIDAHYAQVREEMVAEAPRGIEDPQASVERYEALVRKWTDIVLELGYDTGHATKAEWAAATPDGPGVDLQPWADRVESEVLSQHLAR